MAGAVPCHAVATGGSWDLKKFPDELGKLSAYFFGIKI
jgi:hypothetical protein